MPNIYYSYYTPICNSIPAVAKQEHMLGRELLRKGLEHFYSLSFSPESLPSVLAALENGKPYLKGYPEIHFNISHCNGLAVCAFHNHPIGIDAEQPGYFPRVLINKALSAEEKSFLQAISASPVLEQEWFYRFWTLKEAYVKLSGTGLDVILTDFSFHFSDTAAENDHFSVRCSNPDVSCYQQKLNHGQILSLCCSGSMDKVCFYPHHA